MVKLMDQPLDNEFGIILNKAAVRLKCEVGRRFKAYDVTTEQWVVLRRLWEKDGLTQKELAERIMKDQPNITRILDKLEQKGLIRRMDNVGDRRAFLVFLTEAGRRQVETLSPIARGVREDACRGLTEKELELLKALLKRVWRNLE